MAPRTASPSSLLAVYRRWKRAEARRRPYSWWSEPPRVNLGKLSMLGSILLIPVAGIIDGFLAAGGSPTGQGVANKTWAIAILLAGCWVHGWQLDRLIAQQSRGEAQAATVALILRRLIAALPFVGWLAIPWWRQLDARRPPWAFRSAGIEPGPVLREERPFGRRPVPRPARGRTYPGRRVLVLVVGSLALVSLTASQILGGHDTGWPRRFVLIGAVVVVHVLGFGLGLAHFLIERARSREGEDSLPWRVLFVGSWLAPIPLFPFLMLIPAVLDNPPAPRASTLVAKSFAVHSEVGSRPRWSLLRRRLHAGWSWMPWVERLGGRPLDIDVAMERGAIEERIDHLAQFKTVCLFFDAACLAWLLLTIEGHVPAGESWSRPLLGLLTCVTLPLGVLCLVATLVTFVYALLSTEDRLPARLRQSVPAFGTAANLGFFAGLFLGDGLFQGNLQEIGGVFLAIGTAGAVAKTLPSLISLVIELPAETGRQEHERTLWILGFIAVAFLGLSLRGMQPPTGAPFNPWVLFVLFASVCGIIVGTRGLKWLLHPGKWRDVLRPDTDRPPRRRIALLALSAVLPLGGLAAPFWPLIRRQVNRRTAFRRSAATRRSRLPPAHRKDGPRRWRGSVPPRR
jgi:hypothetical protein